MREIGDMRARATNHFTAVCDEAVELACQRCNFSRKFARQGKLGAVAA